MGLNLFVFQELIKANYAVSVVQHIKQIIIVVELLLVEIN